MKVNSRRHEEKASYIARELVNMGVRGEFDIAKKAAIMMAEWKDKQYQSRIDDSSVKNDGFWIDLVLPSGTLWADRNVGAVSIEDNGNHFIFKEAQKQGNIPTIEQFEELIKECKWTWMGKGYEVVGKNGNSIYLPAAGFWAGTEIYAASLRGCYWSSFINNNNYAIYLGFSSDNVGMFYNNCYFGQYVRFVK